MKIKLIDMYKIANDSWSLEFSKPAEFNYEAGQFVKIILEHENTDDRGDHRWFTLSSSPTEPNITITTRLMDNPSSFKKALFNLEKDGEVLMDDAEGSFILPKDKNVKIAWLAGGIGITPFRSQIRYLLDTKDYNREIKLLYSNRTAEDICFNDVWHDAKSKMPNLDIIQTLVENAPGDWTGKKGMIDIEMIKAEIKDYKDYQFFLSGPEKMVEDFKPMLMSIGIEESSIHQDWFPNYTEEFFKISN